MVKIIDNSIESERVGEKGGSGSHLGYNVMFAQLDCNGLGGLRVFLKLNLDWLKNSASNSVELENIKREGVIKWK